MKMPQILAALIMLAPLFATQEDPVLEADYDEDMADAAREIDSTVPAAVLEKERGAAQEAMQLLQSLIRVGSGIVDRATADAAAPEILRINTRLNECLNSIRHLEELENEVKEIEQLMVETGKESQRLGQARLYGSVELARASGFSAAVVREHEELTLQDKEHIGKLLMARYAGLAAKYPQITGGPGWDEECAWVVEDSDTETQQALVEDIIGGIGTEAEFDSAFYISTGERSYTLLRLSLRIGEKYYFLPIYVDITGRPLEATGDGE